ncbi:MAG: 5'/3'-nucleotidase SurE [Gemmatimonadetes bacterium]|nr:5'/3'-nucleotidase SurE [Gemmatimonadota bacterium]
MNVLLTNDDGIHAHGLNALREGLSGRDLRLTVVAPDREQSATSHAITLGRPLRIDDTPRGYAVDGTPTDCVWAAVHGILKERPDVVVSGINHGPNLGEDVTYSGTVAAAFEAHILGIPAIALSMTDRHEGDWAGAAALAAGLVELLRERRPARRTLLNVNFPSGPASGWGAPRITRLGTRTYSEQLIENVDPRGRKYYWIGGAEPTWEGGEDTDFAVVHDGGVSVTPLHLELTDESARTELLEWDLSRVGS